jgi:hypothetical protein
MTEDFDRRMKVNQESEKMFRETCDENSYTYLYIDQDIDKFSSKIYKDKGKRPDYILSVPHLGSIFVDVKAYKEQLFFKDALQFKKQRNPKAFWLKKDEITKFLHLQEETSMKVWYAIMPIKDDILINETHFLPVDLAQKFMCELHRTKDDWNYVQVPIHCFQESSKLANNKCGSCNNRYCEQVEVLIKIDEQIHNQKYGKN